MNACIVILGGYGLFGSRIARRLARDAGLRVVVAGRNAAAAKAYADVLRKDAGTQAAIEAVACDARSAMLADELARLDAQVVINTAGPFQGQDYACSRAALRAGAHCIDLADAREYVAGFDVLDDEARAAGRLAVSGASTVPGISAAVVDELRGAFARLDGIDIGISPGNRTERGLATVAAILSYVGRALPWREHGRRIGVRGWQRLARHTYPAPVGTRWLAACDVPDLALFPDRYAPLADLRFRAGLELKRLHFGLWMLSWLARTGIVNLPRHAALLKRMSEWFRNAGSDAGAMHVTLSGTGADGMPLTRTWEIVARDGDGPEIPATPAVVIATKLARGELTVRGARACLDLFTLEECVASLDGFAIETRMLDSLSPASLRGRGLG